MAILDITDFKTGAGEYLYDNQLVEEIVDDSDFLRATDFVKTFGMQRGVAVEDMDLDQQTANFEVKRLAVYWVLSECSRRLISLNPNFPQIQSASNMDEFAEKAKIYTTLLNSQKKMISIAMLKNKIESPEQARPASFDFYRA